jgi:hypothetical protein
MADQEELTLAQMARKMFTDDAHNHSNRRGAGFVVHNKRPAPASAGEAHNNNNNNSKDSKGPKVKIQRTNESFEDDTDSLSELFLVICNIILMDDANNRTPQKTRDNNSLFKSPILMASRDLAATTAGSAAGGKSGGVTAGNATSPFLKAKNPPGPVVNNNNNNNNNVADANHQDDDEDFDDS